MESNEAAIIHRLLDHQAQLINVILAQYGQRFEPTPTDVVKEPISDATAESNIEDLLAKRLAEVEVSIDAGDQ